MNLRDVPGLDTSIEEAHGGLRLGPMVKLASLAAHPLIRERYPALADAAADSASPQIRNVATLLASSLRLGNPAIADFDVRAFHSGPGDTMRRLFLARFAGMRGVGMVEGLPINILGMGR